MNIVATPYVLLLLGPPLRGVHGQNHLRFPVNQPISKRQGSSTDYAAPKARGLTPSMDCNDPNLYFCGFEKYTGETLYTVCTTDGDSLCVSETDAMGGFGGGKGKSFEVDHCGCCDPDDELFCGGATGTNPRLFPSCAFGDFGCDDNGGVQFWYLDVRKSGKYTQEKMACGDPTEIPEYEKGAEFLGCGASALRLTSAFPSDAPSSKPSTGPSSVPSSKPSTAPSESPSSNPSARPSQSPSSLPSTAPSFGPTAIPSSEPSMAPTDSCLACDGDAVFLFIGISMSQALHQRNALSQGCELARVAGAINGSPEGAAARTELNQFAAMMEDVWLGDSAYARTGQDAYTASSPAATTNLRALYECCAPKVSNGFDGCMAEATAPKLPPPPAITQSCKLNSAAGTLTSDGGEFNIVMTALPSAQSDVSVEVFVRGDVDGAGEVYAVTAEGSAPIGTVGGFGGGLCINSYLSTAFTVTQAVFNGWIVDSQVDFLFDASEDASDSLNQVDAFCTDNDGFIGLTYVRECTCPTMCGPNAVCNFDSMSCECAAAAFEANPGDASTASGCVLLELEQSCGGASFSPIAHLANTTNLGLADETIATVDLNFTFNWLGVEPINQIEVNSNGQINIDLPGATGIFSADPIDGFGPARIALAKEDLDPSQGGGVYVTQSTSSITVSFEDVPFFSSGGSANVQAELFPNGSVTVCFGTSLGSDPISSGLEDPDLGVALPAPLAGFSSSGVSSQWPTNQCYCLALDGQTPPPSGTIQTCKATSDVGTLTTNGGEFNIVMTALPSAEGDVSVEVFVRGDVDGTGEVYAVTAEGSAPIGTVGGFGGGGCINSYLSTAFTVTQAAFNGWIVDSQVDFLFDASEDASDILNQVDTICTDNDGFIELTYDCACPATCGPNTVCMVGSTSSCECVTTFVEENPGDAATATGCIPYVPPTLDQTCGAASFSSIAGLPGTTTLTLLDDDVETVNLLFTFNWMGVTPINQIGISSNGQINIGDIDNKERNASPITGSAAARIALAREDLNPNNAGGVYVVQSSSSITVSFEEVPFFSSGGSANVQAELFPDGLVTVCFGSSTGSDQFSSGFEDPDLGVVLPAPGPSFDSQGLSTQWPTNECYCLVFP